MVLTPRVSADAVANLIDALGTVEFDTAIRQFVLSHIAYDHLTAFHFSYANTPHPTAVRSLLAFSEHGHDVVHDATRCYLNRHWSKDPLLRAFRTSAERGDTRFFQVAVDELPDRHYRRDCYDVDDILERVSLVSPAPAGSLVINLYRSAYSPGFSEGEVEQLRAVADVSRRVLIKELGAIVSRETADNRTPLLRAFNNSLTRLGMGLSRRERETCEGILCGASTASIAGDLGVGESSVITFRRRAYRKLGVADRLDLVAFALGRLG